MFQVEIQEIVLVIFTCSDRRSCQVYVLGISIEKFPHALALSFHQIYSSNWGHRKALGILFKWVYGNMISNKRWLGDRPKCWRMHVNLGTTQKAKKIPKVLGGLNYMKSITIFKNVVQLLNLGYLETSKSNFKKSCYSKPEKSKLEKVWFGRNWRSFILWDGQK